MNGENRNFPFQVRATRTVLCGIVIGILTLFTSLAQAAKDKLLFLGNKNIAPVVYLENGVPAGVAVDIVHALAKHLPQPVEIKAMDWEEAQKLVARGEADVLIQINPTEERRKLYDFSDTLLESQFSIFTTTDRVGMTGISSLRGLRVGVEAGGLPLQVLERDPRIHITIIPDFLEGFKRLKNAALDAVVVDYRVGSYVIAENRLRNIKVTGKPIAFSYSSFAVKKGNTALLNAINTALGIIKADGSYREVIDRWKPEEVIFQTQEQISQKIHNTILVILLILLLTAATWTVTLRRELSKRKAVEERLRGQEARYRALFEDSPISLWEEDYSDVKLIVDALRTSGISDVRAYFEEHPEEVARCARSAKIIEVNHTTLTLFKADSRERLLEGLDSLSSSNSFDLFREELITLANGGTRFRSEAVHKNLEGDEFYTVVQLSIAPEYGDTWERVYVSVSDITDRRLAERALKASEEELHRLNEDLEQRVKQRTAELEAKNAELHKMNRLFVGRELRMVELKERIKALEGLPGGNLDIP